MVRRRTIRRGLAGPVALVVLAMLPGVAAADTLPTYGTAPDAEKVNGKPTTGDAPPIGTGTYTDSIKRGERKTYAVTLDATSSAYVSAVAAPAPHTKVQSYTDELTVSLQDSQGTTCSADGTARFMAGQAYPVADYAFRRVNSDTTDCRRAGTYYVVLERSGDSAGGSGTWPVELRYMTEPGLKGNEPDQPGDGTWSSATPAPPTGSTKKPVAGGTGFNDAAAVGNGLWKDRVEPGETRFYRVPVSWGQQLNFQAELSSAVPKSGGSGVSTLVSDAFGLTAYNPARGLVSSDSFESYEGKQTEVGVFTAPVEYGNRFSTDDDVSPMRFAGWYYLAVTLSPDAAKYFEEAADITLKVDLKGEPKPGPGYATATSDFSVSPEDRETADKGQSAAEAEQSGHLRTVGYAGLGAGVVLLLGLGVWTLAARRRAASGAATAATSASDGPAGPSAGPGPGGALSGPSGASEVPVRQPYGGPGGAGGPADPTQGYGRPPHGR